MNRRFSLFIALIFGLAFMATAIADPIHDAARTGDMQKLQQILATDVYIDVLDERNYTALHWAVSQGQTTAAKLLVEKGANIHENSCGYTPLQFAAQKSVKMTLLLDPDIIRKVSKTPSVAPSGNSAVAAEPIEAEADPDPVTLQFLLGRAAFEGNTKLVGLLLAHGVDVNSTPTVEEENEGGAHNALYYAVQGGRESVIELLIKNGATVDTGHLNVAVCTGKTKLLELLTSQGVLSSAEDYTQASILSNAVRCGSKETLTYLLHKVSQINYAQTAEYLANDSAKISPDLFAVLFANDADWKTHSARLLLSSLQSGNFRLANHLLSNGLTITNDEANNTLLGAARDGHRESVELLLRQGGNIDTRTEWGNTPVLLAVPYNQLGVVAALLQNGADVNAKNELFNTALHLAAARNLQEMSSLLIRNGARVNARNEDGNTPLLQSVRFPAKFDTTKLLVGNKANVNAQNERGMTALHYLAIKNTDYRDFDQETRQGNPEIPDVQYWQRPDGWGKVEEEDRVNAMKLLIDGGADVSLRNKRGESALDLELQYSKNPAVIKMLAGTGKQGKSPPAN